jgi:translocation and assembly module TamA
MSCFCTLYSLSYEVKFIGLKNNEIINSIKNSASLFLLQDSAPRTINSLRYRVESDLPGMVKTFHAYGYFDATVNYDLEEDQNVVEVFIFCDPGPRYLLNKYEVCTFPCEENTPCKNFPVDLKKLELELGEGTNSKNLIDAKAKLLTYLADKGYPLAKLEKEEIQADGIRKIINVKICIDPGPFCKFGPISIFGLKDIYPKFIMKKIVWKENAPFTPDKIRETQSRLTSTGLFSSVSITHGDKADSENGLPIKIQVIEANHQNFTLGVNYATVDGPGAMGSYTNYNVGNMGEIISIHGEFAKKALTGYLTFKKPDLIWYDQDLISTGYALRERIIPYHSYTYGLAAKLIHRVNKIFHYAYGLRGEQINISHSANRGRFLVIGTPFYCRYDTSNHLLNPTRGVTVIYINTPYFDLDRSGSCFLKQSITTNFYIPFQKNEKLILATRLQLGSIAGQSVYHVPITKLFLAGSEDDLRGYRYKTVGPRNKRGDIIGGRSSIYLTFEPRLRITKNIGIVPFFDMGNIQLDSFPTWEGKWRKSVGLGFRYFTFLGPLRLDVAHPLDKYRKGDANFRFYFSIGQTF